MQTSFSEFEYASKKKLTRRDRFLAEIEAVRPWAILEKTIAPFYPSTGGRGRPAVGLGRMLRMYIAQQCCGLSDEGIETPFTTAKPFATSLALIWDERRRRMRRRS
jgi:IS5 family transposase